MCSNPKGVKARRRLNVSGGSILQCMMCGSVGVEFGTSYLTFGEDEFVKFACWFDQLEASGLDDRKERSYIQVQGSDGGTMLALAPGEIRSLAELLREGLRWLPENHPPQLEGPRIMAQASATVH